MKTPKQISRLVLFLLIFSVSFADAQVVVRKYYPPVRRMYHHPSRIVIAHPTRRAYTYRRPYVPPRRVIVTRTRPRYYVPPRRVYVPSRTVVVRRPRHRVIYVP
ncbi:hypothetical protein [Spirosoma pomorum]